MLTAFVIQRRDGWFWRGPGPDDHRNEWIADARHACTFADWTEAALAALDECPGQEDDWAIVGIRLPEPVAGHPV
jgi:hypothetical protein